ncbi:MAG TPA: GNAT family N-acetyltransferase [Candidatus Limnocylindria bacterium]|jgi:ribosomal protein S18 acetylase RimI-like enzyme|nr:GNAT family N-acetyltransferase [Candidatus Limnocylindria bacterium]
MREIRVESFGRHSTRSWNTIRTRIGQIERECFGEDAFGQDELLAMFTGERTLAVLLWDGPPADELLVGYTQSEPRGPDTFYIANTAIARSHQGRGLVKTLMGRLYADVRAAGARFIERDAAIANGYADKVVRAHAADIVETFDHDSEYGPQRFIRMRVPE